MKALSTAIRPVVTWMSEIKKVEKPPDSNNCRELREIVKMNI